MNYLKYMLINWMSFMFVHMVLASVLIFVLPKYIAFYLGFLIAITLISFFGYSVEYKNFKRKAKF